MAKSEMPKPTALRKRFDDRSTNKIYASGQPSAIELNRTIADSTQAAVKAPKTGANSIDLTSKSTDKYYRAADRGKTAQQVIAAATKVVRAAKPTQGTRTPRRQGGIPPIPAFAGPLVSADQLPSFTAQLAARLTGGETQVAVVIPHGNGELLRRTRAAIEMLVTQQRITEAQYHEVRLAYAPGPKKEKAPGLPPAQSPAPFPDVPELPEPVGDPLTYLDEEIEITIEVPSPVIPIEPVEVAVAEAEIAPPSTFEIPDTFAATEEPADDEPAAEIVEEVIPEAVAEEPEVATTPKPRQTGRRTGRGSNSNTPK